MCFMSGALLPAAEVLSALRRRGCRKCDAGTVEETDCKVERNSILSDIFNRVIVSILGIWTQDSLTMFRRGTSFQVQLMC